MEPSELPVLTVFVGAGGVGKTTLSAAWSLARARAGHRVGLLGIDPAQRLLSALGVSRVEDTGSALDLPFCAAGELRVSVLNVRSTFVRWVREEALADEERVLAHPFVQALTERFASAADLLAAARIGEWLERRGDLEELVLDTAPGGHAIDFLARPDRLTEFLESRVVEWLRWFLGKEQGLRILSPVRSGVRRLLDGLSVMGGENYLVSFAEIVVLLERVLDKLLERLRRARDWLRSPRARFLVVATVRQDSVRIARDLCVALEGLGIEPHAVVLNRTVEAELVADAGFLKYLNSPESVAGGEHGFVRYAQEYLWSQREISQAVSEFAPRVVEMGFRFGADGQPHERLHELAELGEILFRRSHLSE